MILSEVVYDIVFEVKIKLLYSSGFFNPYGEIGS